MKSSYAPKKLNKSLVEISKRHPLKSVPPEYRSDLDFIEMVTRWAYLPEEELEEEATIIPPRRLRQLVEYVSKNVLALPMDNLSLIIKLRTTEEIFRRMFLLWQETYASADFNKLLYDIVCQSPHFADNVFLGSKLNVQIFLNWLQCEYIPLEVGKTCIHFREETQDFEHALQMCMISPDSMLGKACIDDFYTYCGKRDYELITDHVLERILQRYGEVQIHNFLHNFLSLMAVPDFQRFYCSGKFIRKNYTANYGTKRFDAFFSNYSKELIAKYRRWLDYITIRESFRDNAQDERLIFWSKYVPYTEGTHMEAMSRSLILKFEQYVIVEFTEETMGALYVYEKGDFETKIQWHTRTKSNTDLRSYLYNDAKRVERIIHNGNWQRRTERYLRRNRIAKK